MGRPPGVCSLVLHDGQCCGKLWRYGLGALVAAIGLTVGIIHYRRKGDQFQRELDALASMDE